MARYNLEKIQITVEEFQRELVGEAKAFPTYSDGHGYSTETVGFDRVAGELVVTRGIEDPYHHDNRVDLGNGGYKYPRIRGAE